MRRLLAVFVVVGCLSQETPSQLSRPISSECPILKSSHGSAETRDQADIDEQLSQARQMLLKARALIHDIPESHQEVAAANISGQLVRACDLTDALATARYLKKPEAEAFAMGSIAWQLVNYGDTTQALFLVQTTAESQSRDASYESIARKLIEKGDVDQGLEATHFIKDPSRVADILIRLASLRTHAGDQLGAGRVLADALQVAETAIKKDPASGTIFNQIAQVQVDIGETPETSFALRRFSAFAYRQKTDRGETSYLQILASTKARLGDIVGATEIIGELSGTSADFAHMGIAEEWAWRGSIAEAMTGASQISDTRLRDSTLREIALNRTDKINLSDSLEAINKIDDSPARSEALATLAVEQAQNGNPAVFHTLQLWHASFEGASEFAKDGRGTIAVTYGLLGEFEQARQVLDTLDPESRTWPLWNVTSFLASRGRTQEAIDLANQEESAQPRLHALLGTAQGILDRVSQPKDSTNESFSK